MQSSLPGCCFFCRGSLYKSFFESVVGRGLAFQLASLQIRDLIGFAPCCLDLENCGGKGGDYIHEYPQPGRMRLSWSSNL